MHIFSLSPRLCESGIYVSFLVSVLQTRELRLSLLHNKHCGSFCNGILAILGFSFASPSVFGFILCETRKTKPETLMSLRNPVLPKPFPVQHVVL